MKKDNVVEKLTLTMRNDLSADWTSSIDEMADLEICDRDGRTLLINAAFYNRIDIAELLIRRGANVNARDNVGNTPLHAAVQQSNLEMMHILLENGAEVNSKNHFGNTPLWITKPLQPKEVFLLLLSFGADPEIKNDYGISAIDCMGAYPKILEMFKAANTQTEE